jgi:hypothetical protein
MKRILATLLVLSASQAAFALHECDAKAVKLGNLAADSDEMTVDSSSRPVNGVVTVEVSNSQAQAYVVEMERESCTLLKMESVGDI